jgi:hypothetical protein
MGANFMVVPHSPGVLVRYSTEVTLLKKTNLKFAV